MTSIEAAQPRRRAPKVLIGVGVVLALIALGWTLVAVPALVKYPTDLSVSPRYEGTFKLFVNPTTAAPLDEAVEVPLAVDREIEAIEDGSTGSKVLVRETIHQKAGDLVDTTYTNQYVMDRRTLENVADPRAYAFSQGNVVDRSPAYRVQLPFGTDTGKEYSIYKNETDATYTLTGAGTEKETYEAAGLTLTRFEPRAEAQPLSEAYLAELNKVVPLPQSLTLEQLKPQLKVLGFDVDATLAALLPVLSEEDLAALVELAGDPIGLQYLISFGGDVGVETTTGSEVEVAVTETLAARPVSDNVAALAAILGKYPQVPEAVTASEKLAELSDAAIPIYTVDYAQTDASVAEIAAEVKDQRQLVVLAQQWIPWGVGVAAAVALAAGIGLLFRGRTGREAVGTRAVRPRPRHA